MRRRLTILLGSMFVILVLGAGPALACGGLVNPNGSVSLVRTTTMAGYKGGIEHYITSFEFAGGGGEFGSIVPLPGIPTDVIRGGDWTLQRLVREVTPVQRATAFALADSAGAPEAAEVLFETTIDALDITVLKGGGDAVGEWAKQNGFLLTPDAPEMLDFYAERSPIFMAAKFDASKAEELGQNVGDGTPIHLVIPTDRPWVPLRILALGRKGLEPVEADIFLLTNSDRPPALLPNPVPGALAGERSGLVIERSEPASELLLADLRSDKGMKWIPKTLDGMWLTYLRVDSAAEDLTYDLAIDAKGTGQPSPVDAGLVEPGGEIGTGIESLWTAVAVLSAGVLLLGLAWLGRRGARVAI